MEDSDNQLVWVSAPRNHSDDKALVMIIIYTSNIIIGAMIMFYLDGVKNLVGPWLEVIATYVKSILY
jgi:hypothetical protein